MMRLHILSCLLCFSVAIFLTSCGGDAAVFDNFGANNPEPLTLNEACHYDITLLDTSFKQDSEDGDRTCILGSKKEVDPVSGMTSTIRNAGLTDQASGYGLVVSKGTLTFNTASGTTPTNTEFESMFEKGDYDFSMDAENGFQLVFMDDDGVEWSSSKGDAINSSNWLSIKDMVSGDVNGVFSVTIRAEFSCGMANDVGDLRGCNGTFVMTFQNE